ncbi:MULTISPECIES: FecR family protein [Pseudomonas]|uniref:FecR family protein n=1 Tax=Pseudomonas TaxID=286 RepID=UPI0008C5683A|nr:MULTISPECIES: FecR family protein [Pseudomonas]PZP04007.1 MAG: fec operon regulator FecR [Pseudomonas protegens]ROM19135.1 iron dicitrate transport regulator FecR [Pseudomonas protegens]SES28822.1 FecR family protein [Pseudomonas sp. NFPP19]
MSFAGLQLSVGERQAISGAARWYAQLRSGSASEQEQAAWREWLAADPLHRQAWERMQQLGEQMSALPGGLAGSTLRGAGRSRRELMRNLVVLASAGSLGWLGWRSDSAQQLLADYRTQVGERRQVRLADGTSLLLNTNTSINVQFDSQQRKVQLLWGEMLVSTAADPLQRPFRVFTRDAEVLALGTRFVLRSDEREEQVAVLEHAVQVSLGAGLAPRRVEAGQQLAFSAGGFAALRPNDAAVGAWRQGSIIAIDRPLGELLADLSRYRRGVVQCDPQIAGLKISGAFPIDDTDRALAALESGFSLQIKRYTRYWVRVCDSRVG